jgi:VWFA-related protein
MFRLISLRFALLGMCAFALIASLSSLLAQQPTTAPPPSSEAQRFGVSTAAVVVDAVVRDKSGKPVLDLAAADFELLEDDVRQDIGNVSLVAPPPGSAPAGASLPVPPAAAPSVSSNTVSTPTIVALVFDRLSPEGRSLAWKGAQAYLDTAPANDFAGVFVVSNGLEVVHTYTSDRTALKKALEEAASRATANFNKKNDKNASRFGDRSADTPITVGASERGPAQGSTPTNPGGTASQVPTPGQGTTASAGGFSDAALRRVADRMDRSYEAMMRDEQGYATTNALLALIDSLSLLPGRKTIVFFAEGLALPPAVMARFDSVVATANRANVSVYSVDSAGLRVHSDQMATAMNVNALGNAALDRTTETEGKLTENLEFNEDNLRKDPSVSLKLLADRTGGFLINNTNNLARAFQTIDADRRFHYLLTYAPKNTNFQGEWRRITVKVPKRSVEIRSRTGYLAAPGAGALPILAYEGPALAALERKPLPADLPLRAGVFPMPGPKRPGRLALLAAVEAPSLTFQSDATSGAWRTDFTVLARIRDASGEIVRKASQPYKLSGPSDQLAAAKRGDVLFFRQPDLPPGTYTLEAVVNDALGQKAGATTKSFVVPEAKPGAMVASSLVIVHRTEKVPANERTGDNPLYFGELLLYPNLGEPLGKAKDKTLSFYFTIDPAPGGVPSATLEIVQGAQSLAQLPMDLPKPDATGRISHVAQLPLASFPPGSYILRITLTQGGQKEVRDAPFTVVE